LSFTIAITKSNIKMIKESGKNQLFAMSKLDKQKRSKKLSKDIIMI